MATIIKLKRGTSTPTTSDLSNGEVGIDTSAKKFYINDSGTIKEIGGSTGDATSPLAGDVRGYTGDGSTTAYTVSSGADVENVLVFVNGVYQRPTTDYTISGTTLSFGTAPASADAVTIKELVEGLNSITFADDSSTTTEITSGDTPTLAGGTGISSSISGDTATFAIDNTVVTTTGSQTLTNKTLTTPIISSISNTGTLTLPTNTDTLVGRDTTDTLTNKTLTSAVLNTGVSGTAVLDEDNMASDSATQLATQQSIKAYVDTQVGAVSTSSISQGNSDVTVTDSGTGAITVSADGSTIITMNATTALDASATTNAIRLPNGTTAQRPSGAVGEIRYNSSTDTIEGYTSAGGWAQLGATTATAENTDDTTTGDGTAISTSQGVIDQFVTSSFDSAWYLTVTRDEINDEVSTAKHSLVHNDSSAFVATSHITESDPTNAYLTAQADVAGGNARLLGTGGSVVNSVSTYRIALGDNTSAGTTGNVVTSINTDVDSASEVVDSWAHANYRGAKYYISVNNASKTEVSNMEALVVHDGTTAFITTYGLVNTGANDLLSLTAAINGSNVELSAAGNEPNLRVTMYKILLADDESASTGDNVNVVEATTVSSAATTIDSFATTAYTGAFYVFTGHNATEGASSISEVTVVANDEAYITTGPMVSSKGTDQLAFSASLSGQTVTVQAASTSGASTLVNGYRVHMLRGSAGASTADTLLVSTEQTITGAKTFTSVLSATSIKDTVNSLSAAASVALDPTSGGIQTITLGQATTFTLSNWASGHRMTLMIDDGSNYAVTWPTMQWAGGVAPTLATSGFNTIELWYVGSTLYGAYVGA